MTYGDKMDLKNLLEENGYDIKDVINSYEITNEQVEQHPWYQATVQEKQSMEMSCDEYNSEIRDIEEIVSDMLNELLDKKSKTIQKTKAIDMLGRIQKIINEYGL